MRAALLESANHIVMIKADKPGISNPDEVLIQVKAVGICGSEIHAFEGIHPFRKAPVIMGHEMSGVVAGLGDHVEGIEIGERVFVDPQWTCGQCHCCRSGNYNQCAVKKVLGTNVWPGAFGEYVVVPRETVFHLPDKLSFVQGAMIEPLSVAVHIARRAHLAPGASVAILGTGSIGGMFSGVARAFGAETIISVDIQQHCLEAARERMGATHDFLLPDDHFVSKVTKLTGGDGVDSVIISADDVALVNHGLEIVKRGGNIMMVALMITPPIGFIGYNIVRKEVSMIGSFMGNHEDVIRSMELAVSGQVDVSGIVTHQLPVEQAQLGMELASTKRDNAIKVVLKF
jgi:L-iditol 2-dehydrogenase